MGEQYFKGVLAGYLGANFMCGPPKDFTYEEVLRLFGIFGYSESNKGATSGSRVEFVSEDGQSSYIMHKPHPGNIIKSYVMKQLHAFVDNNKLVEKFNINNTQKKGE